MEHHDTLLRNVGDPEKRTWPRIPTSFKAFYADPKGHFREEEVINLSKGGLFLKTQEPSETGELLELILAIPESQQEITVQGQVIHNRKPTKNDNMSELSGMGIMFTTIEPQLKNYLGNYITTLFQKEIADKRSDTRYQSPPNQVILHANEKEHSAILKNISKGGMLVHTEHPLVLFEIVSTVLTHPDTGLQFDIDGEVIHLQKLEKSPQCFAAGIKFIGLDSDSQDLIHEMIREIMFRQKMNQI